MVNVGDGLPTKGLHRPVLAANSGRRYAGAKSYYMGSSPYLCMAPTSSSLSTPPPPPQPQRSFPSSTTPRRQPPPRDISSDTYKSNALPISNERAVAKSSHLSSKLPTSVQSVGQHHYYCNCQLPLSPSSSLKRYSLRICWYCCTSTTPYRTSAHLHTSMR